MGGVEPTEGEGGTAPQPVLSSRSAAVTGGVTGSALATFAQTIREPYRTYLMLIAPAATAAITSTWPRISAGIARWYGNRRAVRRLRMASEDLQQYIREQERLLADSKLPKEMKSEIRENIRKAQGAIIRINFRAISRHVDEGGH